MEKVCGDYFECGRHSPAFRYSTQLLSWVKTVSASTDNANFQKSECSENILVKALFDQHMHGLVYVSHQPNNQMENLKSKL